MQNKEKFIDKDNRMVVTRREWGWGENKMCVQVNYRVRDGN